MDVTKSNFLDKYDLISQSIAESSFMSVDCEFSGISREDFSKLTTAAEIFEKYTRNTSEFIIVQLGLSCFKVCTAEENDSGPLISCQTFNFYVLPQGDGREFKLQSESYAFLAKNGFDFNRLFQNGISSVNKAEEAKLRQDLKKKQKYRIKNIANQAANIFKSPNSNTQIPITKTERAFLDQIENQILVFLESGEDSLKLTDCNGFQRKLVYELINGSYDDLLTFNKSIDNEYNTVEITYKRTLDEQMLVEEQRKSNEDKELKEAVGLALLIRKISRSRKLLVGHNILCDVMFIVRQFFEPVSEDLNEFKELVNRTFPNIIDTKFVSSSEAFKDLFSSSKLEFLLKKVAEPPFEPVKIEWEDESNSYSLDDPKGHEAGYDAFITGVLFLHLAAYLKFDWRLFNEVSDYNTLKPFLNHIPLPHRKPIVINLMKRNPEASKSNSISSESPAAPSMNPLQLIFWIIGKLIEFLFKKEQPQLMDQLKEHSVDERPHRS